MTKIFRRSKEQSFSMRNRAVHGWLVGQGPKLVERKFLLQIDRFLSPHLQKNSRAQWALHIAVSVRRDSKNKLSANRKILRRIPRPIRLADRQSAKFDINLFAPKLFDFYFECRTFCRTCLRGEDRDHPSLADQGGLPNVPCEIRRCAAQRPARRIERQAEKKKRKANGF